MVALVTDHPLMCAYGCDDATGHIAAIHHVFFQVSETSWAMPAILAGGLHEFSPRLEYETGEISSSNYTEGGDVYYLL